MTARQQNILPNSVSFTINNISTANIVVNNRTDSNVADITITPIQICGAQIITGTSISFGTILPDETSGEYAMSIQNTGNLQGTISMSGNSWTDEDDNRIMTAGVTKYSVTSNDYTSKTHLSETAQDVLVLGLGETKDIFLQLQADLFDLLFSGDLEQTIEVNLVC